MLRVRSLAVSCTREVFRSRSVTRGGGARATAACHAARTFSDSSQVLIAPQPPPHPVTGHDSHVPSERAAAMGATQQQSQLEEVGGVEEKEGLAGDILQQQQQQQQACAGGGETSPGGISQLERNRIANDLLFRIRALSTADAPTKARESIRLLDEGRSVGVVQLAIYKAVFKHLISVSRSFTKAPENMAGLLRRMRQDGLQPDITTYNHVLNFYAQAHVPKEAQRIYEEMLSTDILPDQKTLSHMIMAHSRGCPNAMYRAVKELKARKWPATRGAYQGMIAIMARHKDWEGVLDTMRCMLEEGQRPTEAAFVAAFRAAEHLERPEVCKSLFEHRLEAGFPPKAYAYAKVMAVLLKADKVDECLEYWRHLVCVNGLHGLKITSETYDLAIKCMATIGDLVEVETALKMMQAQGVKPDSSTYHAALHGLTGRYEVEGSGNLNLVGQVFEAIEAVGPPPSERVQKRLAAAYSLAGMSQEAIDVFESLLAKKSHLSPIGWGHMVKAQFKLKKYADMKKSMSRSFCPKRATMEHTSKTLEYAMEAAEHLGDADWALQLRRTAIELGKGGMVLDNVLAKVLARADRAEEASDILKAWEALEVKGAPSKVFQEAYELLLAACKRSGDAEIAVGIVEGMRSAEHPYRPDSSSLAFVLTALKEHGRAKEAVALFEELCAEGDDAFQQPEPECYVVVAEAALEAGDRASTIKFCDEAEKRGLSASGEAVAFAKEGMAASARSVSAEGGESGEASLPITPASFEVDGPAHAGGER